IRSRSAVRTSAETPLGITAYWASVTQVMFWKLPTAVDFGTVPSTIGLMYQPVVVAIMSTVPAARSFIVAVVPVWYTLMYWPRFFKYAQVLAQPLVGSVGALSPSRYGRAMRKVRPGPELAGRAYSNLPGCAFAQSSSSCGVVGGVVTLAGLYSMSGPDG